jgi:hypothetical protein
MRVLSVTRWHHFSYFVISTALLGYGISGTLLSFTGLRLTSNYKTSIVLLCLAMSASIAILFPLAESLPLDIQYLLYSPKQLAIFALYNLLILIPFLFGATAIGLALMRHRTEAPLIYGFSMLGTAIGGAAAVGLMFVLPEGRLILAAAVLGWIAAAVWADIQIFSRKNIFHLAAAGITAAILAAVYLINPQLQIDQYKTLSMLSRWEHQGDAELLLTRHSPRGRLDVFASPLLHYTLFAGLGATTPPPPQLAVLRDGELAGTIFKINSADDAPILDHTPASFPYRILDKPDVLLLGETGGVNVWLARRFGASHITVVQPDPQVLSLITGPLAEQDGNVFSNPDVTIICNEPRTFLERTSESFDIIQIVTAEGMAAGTSGLMSLQEDFLLTTEGIALAIHRLTPRGILAVTRGIQTPPRDELKLFATFADALKSQGVKDPRIQLALVRNYLAATVIAFKSPVNRQLLDSAAHAVNALKVDVEWLPYSTYVSEHPTSTLAGEEGGTESFIGEGARKILGPNREAFYDEWMYNIHPAVDDSPYFYNFFRWHSLPWMMETYGRHWFRRLELGYVILILILIEVAIIGTAFILLPLFRLRKATSVGFLGKAAIWLYFLLLGLGFMALEMTSILRFTRYLGEPVYATSLMIGCFLLSAGLGSIAVNKLRLRPLNIITIGMTFIIILGGLHILFADALMARADNSPYAVRAFWAIITTAPIGFFMGWLFPSGLKMLSLNAEPLIPWAWGINGFASVAAPPLTLMLSMSYGFRFVLISALACYFIAGIIARLFPQKGW